MKAALNVRTPGRGAELLLRHCAALDAAGEPRLPASTRLRQALGPELTRLLLAAFAGPQGRRGSSSP